MSIICKIEPSYSILTTGAAIYFSPSYWDQLPEKLCLKDTGHYILLVFLFKHLYFKLNTSLQDTLDDILLVFLFKHLYFKLNTSLQDTLNDILLVFLFKHLYFKLNTSLQDTLNDILLVFLAATKQLYKWYFPSVRLSVCPSVCPSVRHTFLTMFPSSDHHEIFRSYYQWPT